MDFKKIREMSGLSRPGFYEKYKVPVRTQENWEASGAEKRNASDYILYAYERMVRMDFEIPIYGVSSTHQFGWRHTVYRFSDLEEAYEWLETETYQFAERELMDRDQAIELTEDEEQVDNALEWGGVLTCVNQ